MPDVLKVKNWAEFQHYQDRRPPWIKLHRAILDNRAYHGLPVDSKAIAPLLWLLASESRDGSIVFDLDEIGFRLRMDTKALNKALKPLIDSEFFELVQDASKAQAKWGSEERRGETETEIETEGETEGETETETEGDASACRVVFEHWRQVMKSPRAQLDDKRKRLIKARIKDGYTVEMLKHAVNGCALSPFHMGANERGAKYNGLDLILRNAEKVDQFIGYANLPPRQANKHDQNLAQAKQSINDFAEEAAK